MAPSAFREVAAQAFVHATESEEAVARAILTLVPGARVERVALGGHFGQALHRLTARSSDRTCVNAAVEVLRRAAGPEIASSATQRLSDASVLHVRVDKQAAAQGQPRLAQAPAGDVVLLRFRLRAPRLAHEAAIEIVRGTFGGRTPPEEE